MSDPRSRIPGLDHLLEAARGRELLDRFPRARVVEALREAVAVARERIRQGAWPHGPAAVDPYYDEAEWRLASGALSSLRPVINATGVVLHTNLGRAPLAAEARAAMAEVSAGYSTLEFDLTTGARGSRYDHCAALLGRLTGAADALVVNNCAAALVLVLNTVARDQGVIVSRGELVEIGGGFRIPEMLERAGARMIEVGTTNRTHVADYRAALEGPVPVGAILKVHRSNFRVTGFTAGADIAELAPLAEAAGVPLVHDIGSGLLIDPATLGLPPEPRAADSLAAGADCAVFSGDKLLGGPQAGIIVGGAPLIAAARANPLCRALRVDKATLAALEATLRLYEEPDSVAERVPVLQMLARSVSSIEERAQALAHTLRPLGGASTVGVEPGVGRVGGGTYPDHEVPTCLLRIEAPTAGATRVAQRLRADAPPVVVRVEDGAVLIDLRTVDPHHDQQVGEALARALRGEDE